ncbi:MAG: hypothetical protein PHN64_06625 [Desulfovibrionaceae bacterium]|nr:hypothetical protein [Desulfovibrionaceae bacterium]
MRESAHIKVYGHCYPAPASLYEALLALSGEAIGAEDSNIPVVEQEGDMVRLSFEGDYFPVEDMLQCLAAHLSPQCEGKVDVLDLDAWTLVRHSIVGAEVHSAPARSLNHVLDYSGH